MKNILQLSNPNVYASFVHAPVLHPLVSIVHYDEVSPIHTSLNNYGVYALFIQPEFPKLLTYGMKMFDMSDGSILAIAPGQVGGKEDNGELVQVKGWALLWSPELFHGTDWAERIRQYRFFSYFFMDSLRMTSAEWGRISQLLVQMRHELQESEDTPALRALILGYIHLILEYCNRIYQRQLSAEEKGSSDILKRFHRLLADYYADGRQLEAGVPTVAYCASELAYSARYLGDMIHKATGGTAIGYIHSFIVEQGKNLLMSGHNVNETARLLGFEYAHHFGRIFKKVTQISPLEFLGKKNNAELPAD
ncbi:MAG: AraC family transcriptional regulator [Bacteroidales bacterium]|nr:AraC family transcriptional regulator [Bacteroidales bacterium]